MNIAIAVAAMLALAKFATPQYLRLFAPIAYVLGVLLLIVVDVTGHVGKGAQRWLDIGFMRFQPSEIMKLAVPMMCAWYMHERPLPPTFKDLMVMGVLIAIPTAMIVTQPDLGTALLIAASGLIVMLLAGLQIQIILISIPLLGGAAVGGLAFHPRLSAPAHIDVPESRDRSARRRLPHHPVADRHRFRRRVRQGLHERQPGAARISAGAVDRFHFRRHRRGIRVAGPAVDPDRCTAS